MKRLLPLVVVLTFLACQPRTETANVAATTSTGPSNVTATVIFKGLITHFRDTYQRAAIVYAPGHNRSVRLPVTADIQNVVEKELGGTCTTSCDFVVNYMSMALLDGSKNALSGDLSSSALFDTYVTKLSVVDSTSFDKAQLQSEATGAVKLNSTISWGYFDLHGGNATATALVCQGKFDPNQNAPFFKFPNDVVINYTLTGGGYLRVTDSGNTAHDIPLAGPSLFIEVDNDLGSSVDHFQEYAKLSKLNPTLPKIIRDLLGTCKQVGSGGLPGCSDTQWP